MGAKEIFFPLKFLKAFILFFTTIYFSEYLLKYLNLVKIHEIIILCVVFHSIIIFSCIISPEVRSTIYGFTGYLPRGPQWSRSPGMTLGFNSTAIVHVFALFTLLNQKYFSTIKQSIFIFIILFSLFFLGRSIFLLGFLAIIFLISIKRPVRSFLIMIISVLVLFAFLSFLDEYLIETNNKIGIIIFNLSHFIKIFDLTSAENVLNYFSLVKDYHWSFPSDFQTLMIGNSLAGHLGILDTANSTGSDVGFVNSVNANGLLITLFLYFWYILLGCTSSINLRLGVTLLCSLSLLLSLKETGFFDSHVTPLLFLLYHLGKRAQSKRLSR